MKKKDLAAHLAEIIIKIRSHEKLSREEQLLYLVHVGKLSEAEAQKIAGIDKDEN